MSPPDINRNVHFRLPGSIQSTPSLCPGRGTEGIGGRGFGKCPFVCAGGAARHRKAPRGETRDLCKRGEHSKLCDGVRKELVRFADRRAAPDGVPCRAPGVPCLVDGGDYSSTDGPALPWGKNLRLSSNSVHHYHGAEKTLKWRDSSKRPAMLADKSHRMSATVPRELHYRNRGVIVNIYDGRDVYGYHFDR